MFDTAQIWFFLIILNNNNFTTISKPFSVFRNDTYGNILYRDVCKKFVGIPFDITTKLYSKEQLCWKIEHFHCVAAVRKVLYDTLNIHIPLCYVWNMPKILTDYFGYEKICTDSICNWDIIFLRKFSRDSISHVVLWLDQNQIFHSCRSRNTVIELFDCLDWEYSTEY